MPILPLVDLLIVLGSASLVAGFFLKAVTLVTPFRPTLMGFSSTDFALMTAISFGLALTLVARTWLKLNEPALLSLQSRLRAEQAHQRVREIELANGNGSGAESTPASVSASREGR